MTIRIWDSKARKWRDPKGRFASAPTPEEIRRDKRGRPIDSVGRQVPVSALFVAKPAKPPGTVYDAKTRKWRDERGHWAPRPTKDQIARSRFGIAIDAKGREVPESALSTAKPAKAASPVEPIEREPPPASTVGLEDEWLESEPLEEKLVYGSHLNQKTDISKADAVLQKALEGHSRKGGLEMADMSVNGVGALFIPAKGGVVDKLEIRKIQRIAGPNAKVEIISEGVGFENVRVIWDSEKTTSALEAAERLQRQAERLAEIQALLSELWGDLFWSAVYETDEETY